VKVKLRERDMGLSAALAALQALDKEVQVGVPDDAAYPDGTPVALVGAVHEFGSPENGIPQRSFLRGYADSNRERIVMMLVAQARQVIAGNLKPTTAFNQLGLRVVGEIKQRMAMNIPPPLKPKTIERKGSSVALIDTGILRASIVHRIKTTGPR
jgi:hypothetical protein